MDGWVGLVERDRAVPVPVGTFGRGPNGGFRIATSSSTVSVVSLPIQLLRTGPGLRYQLAPTAVLRLTAAEGRHAILTGFGAEVLI